LAQLDRELGAVFQKRKAQTSAAEQSRLVAQELAWIRKRNAVCGLIGNDSTQVEVLASAKPCMLTEIRRRIAALAPTEPVAPPQQPTVTTEQSPSPSVEINPSAPPNSVQQTPVTPLPPASPLVPPPAQQATAPATPTSPGFDLPLFEELTRQARDCIQNGRQAAREEGIDAGQLIASDLNRAELFFAKRCFDPFYAGSQRLGEDRQQAEAAFWIIVMTETLSPETKAEVRQEVHGIINRLPPP
jgi:hypothetical protein